MNPNGQIFINPDPHERKDIESKYDYQQPATTGTTVLFWLDSMGQHKELSTDN